MVSIMTAKHPVILNVREAKVISGMLAEYSKYLESRFAITPEADCRMLINEEFYEANTLSRMLKEKADA